MDTADIGNLPCEEELVVDVHSLTVSGLPLPICIYKPFLIVKFALASFLSWVEKNVVPISLRQTIGKGSKCGLAREIAPLFSVANSKQKF